MQTCGVWTRNQSAFQNSCRWCFFGEVALAIFLHQPGCCHGRGAELPTLLPRFLLQIGISKWCLKVWISIKTLLHYTVFFGCKIHQMHWQFHLHWPPCCFAPDSHPSLPRSWGFSVGVLLSTCPDAGDALWQGVRNFRAFSLKKRNGDKVRCLNFCNEINEVNQTLAMIP